MPAADLIFNNANVITVDPANPAAEFVAVKEDKILFTGSKENLNIFSGPDTKFIDCGGAALTPGFNDAHCHIFSLLRTLTSIDLSRPEIKSIADIQAAVKDKVKTTPSGEWITGTDYNEFYLAEKRHPTRWEIDEVAPDNPVILSHRSLHGCVLNSKALALAGITIATSEPPGALIDRDVNRDGEPNGFLTEMLGYIREHVMPPITAQHLDAGIRLADEQYLARGITSLQDATIVNDLTRWRHYQHFKEQDLLHSRIYMMTGIDNLQEFLGDGLRFFAGDGHLRLGSVKIVPSIISGKLHPTPHELEAQVLLTHRAGFQLAIHAVQAEMVNAIIRTYEYLQVGVPDFAARRHRIEHCSECPPQMMNRLIKLHPVVVSHPSFTYYSGDRYLETVDKETIPWLYRIGTMTKRGLTVAAGSDSPIVPNSPLMGIYAAVTRKTSSGKLLGVKERLTAARVLKMYTLDAAYASHEENIKGSITAGKLADFVLLSSNPLRATPEMIREIKVRMTVIGGKIVWEG